MTMARTAVNAVSVGLSQASREIGEGLQQRTKRGDTSRVALLIQILSTDGDASVRRTAAWGLNEVQTASVAPALMKALKQDADASVREMSAWALAEHKGDNVAAALADAMLHDKSARVRATAVWALGEIEARTGSQRDRERARRSGCRGAIHGDLGARSVRSSHGASRADDDADRRVAARASRDGMGARRDRRQVDGAGDHQCVPDAKPIRRYAPRELRALAAMGQASSSVVDIALKSNDPELRRHAVAMLAGSDAGVWPWPWPWPQPRPSP